MSAPAAASATVTLAAQGDAKAAAAASATSGGRVVRLVKCDIFPSLNHDHAGITGIGRTLTVADVGKWMVRTAPTQRWQFGFIPHFLTYDLTLAKSDLIM